MRISLDKGSKLALAAAVASGISVYINSAGVKAADPFAYTIFKNAVAGFLFAAAIILAGNFKETIREMSQNAAKLSFIAIAGGAIPFLMFFWGLSLLGGAAGSFIYRFLFVFCAILGMTLLKEKISWKYAAGAVIALAGNFILLGNGAIGLGLGEALVLGATALWAVEWTITKPMLKTISANSIALARMLGGSVAMVAIVVAAGRAQTLFAADATFLCWSAIVGVSLFAFLTLWYSALSRTTLARATAIFTLGGPVTTLVSFAFGQSVSVATASGMLLVSLGIMMAVFSEKSTTNPNASKA